MTMILAKTWKRCDFVKIDSYSVAQCDSVKFMVKTTCPYSYTLHIYIS